MFPTTFPVRTSSAARPGTLVRSAILATAGGCLALPAFAAGDTASETSIFAGDVGNVLWTLLTFGLVIFVLGKFAWGPLLDMLQKREAFIRDSLTEARRDREQAEARLSEYEERLAEARAEATAIVEEGRRDAEVVAARISEEARAEAEKTLERTRREIHIAKETAIKELYDRSGLLATQIASKIVERELRPEDHQKLINDALDELAQAATPAGSAASPN